MTGKVIRYRALKAERSWRDPAVPEYFERDCYDLGNAFESCLIEAGIRAPLLDASGAQVMLPPRAKLGETAARPAWRGIGSPNTLRHTLHTYLQTVGVPQA